MTQRTPPEKVALEIFHGHYPLAKSIFLAGSIVRGEETAHSDIDLVVVFEKIPAAYRRSFLHHGWHVEALVHDPETLNYFFQEDNRNSGIPYLSVLVLDGKELPEVSDFSQMIKRLALLAYEAGPKPWTIEDINRARYMISDICDDMREQRNNFELQASVAQLYARLANFFFRAKGSWSALGKHIPRSLEKFAPEKAWKFEAAFKAAFAKNETELVIALAEEILAPYGGWLFEDAGSTAPPQWRKPLV